MSTVAQLFFAMTVVLLSAALLILSLIHYSARHGPSWLDHFKWLAVASVAVGIPRIVSKALISLRHMVSCVLWSIVLPFSFGCPVLLATMAVFHKAACLHFQVLDINALMLLAVAGALAVGDYTEGAAVVVLFAVAAWLEAGCGRRA